MNAPAVPKITFWRAVFAVLMLAGAYATYLRVRYGLGGVTNLNDQFPWGIWIGFDILFGFTGLLSFGQSAFYGTGGFVAAYLLTILKFPSVTGALFVGMIAAGCVGYLVGLIALTGIDVVADGVGSGRGAVDQHLDAEAAGVEHEPLAHCRAGSDRDPARDVGAPEGGIDDVVAGLEADSRARVALCHQ